MVYTLTEDTKRIMRDFCTGGNCTITIKYKATSLGADCILSKQSVSRITHIEPGTSDSAFTEKMEILLDGVDLELENRRYINDNLRKTSKCRS